MPDYNMETDFFMRLCAMGRRGRSRKQVLDDLKETGGYWILEVEAPGRTVWRTRFGKGYKPVVRQSTELIN